MGYKIKFSVFVRVSCLEGSSHACGTDSDYLGRACKGTTYVLSLRRAWGTPKNYNSCLFKIEFAQTCA